MLDVGYAAHPNPYLRDFQVVGFDRTKPTSDSGYDEHIVGDIAELSSELGGRRFDTILCGEFIEHVERPYDCLRDLGRVLADGGALVLSTPNPLGFPVLGFELVRSKRFFYDADHVYYFPPRWVHRMLCQSGFRVDRTQAVGLWLPFGYLPWCPIALSYQLVYVARHRVA